MPQIRVRLPLHYVSSYTETPGSRAAIVDAAALGKGRSLTYTNMPHSYRTRCSFTCGRHSARSCYRCKHTLHTHQLQGISSEQCKLNLTLMWDRVTPEDTLPYSITHPVIRTSGGYSNENGSTRTTP